jgi:hypothetical protein
MAPINIRDIRIFFFMSITIGSPGLLNKLKLSYHQLHASGKIKELYLNSLFPDLVYSMTMTSHLLDRWSSNNAKGEYA